MSINVTEAIYDFTRKTQVGAMAWKRKELPFEQYANSETTERYATQYKGESMELIVESRVDTEGDIDYHKTIIHLWILDESGRPLWRFPDNDALGDLLSTIRFQEGNVGDRLKRLLEK